MKKEETFNYIKKWLKQKEIKSFFNSKKKGHKKYIRIEEEELYELCYKLIKLIEDNIE